jgi:hypothetical protein
MFIFSYGDEGVVFITLFYWVNPDFYELNDASILEKLEKCLIPYE